MRNTQASAMHSIGLVWSGITTLKKGITVEAQVLLTISMVFCLAQVCLVKFGTFKIQETRNSKKHFCGDISHGIIGSAGHEYGYE